jgi:phosphohistidine phosphatase
MRRPYWIGWPEPDDHARQRRPVSVAAAVRSSRRASPMRPWAHRDAGVDDMDLYLMQHGEATAEAEDPARPLTPAGRATVEQVAGHAGASGVRIQRCLHSGKLRAEQTAQLLARAVAGGQVEHHEGLAPNDPVAPVAAWLRQAADESIAVVGHLPFLDRLASLLVAGDEEGQVIRFQMGGLVKLVPKRDRPGFVVAWALSPEIL